MNRIAVVYASVHHGNTEKLLRGMSQSEPALDLFTVERALQSDLSGYECVGIASGIYYGKAHRSILEYLNSKPVLPTEAFAVLTCGDGSSKHEKDGDELLKTNGLHSHGTYVCKGFDTFGPFKLVGGLNKNHPDDADIHGAVQFLKQVILELDEKKKSEKIEPTLQKNEK